ncbi:MAG: hypothetical protein P8Y64_04435 [Gammaproteobacteria bacterium]
MKTALCVCLVFGLLLTGCERKSGETQEATTSAVQAVTIKSPRDHWRRAGFAELVPPVRLPTRLDRDDALHIWVKVPAGGHITTQYLPQQQRYTLRFPDGTRIARVEAVRYRAADGSWAESQGDVRMATIGSDGLPVRYSVLEPASGKPDAELTGWSWPAGDPQAQAEATGRLVGIVAATPGPLGEPPLKGEELDRFRRLNQCALCHIPNMPSEAWYNRTIRPPRATDASGLFVPLSVLEDWQPATHERPKDNNIHDPYVTVRCGSAPAQVQQSDDSRRYWCPNYRVPAGRRDIRAGLRAHDPYTKRVCAARRYLYERMLPEDRAAFATAFEVCGLN